MGVGYGFNVRLSGSTLRKRLGDVKEDVTIGPNYAYVETMGTIRETKKGATLVFPAADLSHTGRIFVVVNPMLGRLGHVMCQPIFEEGDEVMAVIPDGNVSLDNLGWVFRIYAGRE